VTTTVTQKIFVQGMTCNNCVRHVTEALQSVPGVRSVRVDLPSGSALLETERPVDPGVISAVLDDAGYALAE